MWDKFYNAAGQAGRGLAALGSLGFSEIANNMSRERNAAVGDVLSGNQIPEFLRPGMTPESYTPDQFEQAKMQQLYRLGTPEAAGLATKFLETPETRLQKANVESEIANRVAQRDLQKENLNIERMKAANDASYKNKMYNLAAKELEAKLEMGADPKEIFDREAKLRKEFVDQSKDFITQRDAYDKITIAAKDPSAAGDISLIYGFMKLNDPTSTVREGEYATAQNAGSIDDRIRSMYNKALSGERLAEKVRNDFVDRSKRLFTGSERQHNKRVGQYTDLTKRAGGRPEQVILDLGLAETPKEPVKTQGMTPMLGIKFLGFK